MSKKSKKDRSKMGQSCIEIPDTWIANKQNSCIKNIPLIRHLLFWFNLKFSYSHDLNTEQLKFGFIWIPTSHRARVAQLVAKSSNPAWDKLVWTNFLSISFVVAHVMYYKWGVIVECDTLPLHKALKQSDLKQNVNN